ncbi:MAG TPA: hypothetical protein VLU43_09300 [Anaeromyxobacteraceae bacterium]|nr:hypothetical protein [Anaeromyxobacteraceae bacterium]
MGASIVHGSGHHEVLALWTRLELSAVATMVVGVAFCAGPLLGVSPHGTAEDGLAATGNAFAAFLFGELVCMPFGAWFGEGRKRAIVRPAGAALVLVSAIAATGARSAEARATWYWLAGVGTEATRAWIAGNAVKSPLLRRGPELLALATTCTAVLALGVGLFALTSLPPPGLRTLACCCAGQEAVVVLAVLQTLYPPSPSRLPLG